jgi:hypothetical protein
MDLKQYCKFANVKTHSFLTVINIPFHLISSQNYSFSRTPHVESELNFKFVKSKNRCCLLISYNSLFAVL